MKNVPSKWLEMITISLHYVNYYSCSFVSSFNPNDSPPHVDSNTGVPPLVNSTMWDIWKRQLIFGSDAQWNYDLAYYLYCKLNQNWIQVIENWTIGWHSIGKYYIGINLKYITTNSKLLHIYIIKWIRSTIPKFDSYYNILSLLRPTWYVFPQSFS